ncbi:MULTISPECIES: NAD(P)-dependent oxidoreductase [Rossellomorea]|jgi:3-hydroxyisobutyrate dehydrogenase|uniref:NAD(P)-dependent oxidoreductase n=1 Tax=Rossellomorea TaxID=2837508 RepID=UPI0011E9425B|nr:MULTISPECIES: NAD(P)-dependent oxidoreductase [Rossellomorea]MDT9024338.1 NAD(P)-dependent oxidoreductase [Rossellomorea sp. YC4-1]TYS91631.1 NAD(P)-dependent oxidoreductase [Rossellomorea aquimaris]
MKEITKQSVIGFIGTGVMGQSMAGHLLEAGYQVVIFNRTKDKALHLINRGAKWADTPRQVAEISDAVITIVGYPKDVEEIYLGENGILHHLKRDSLAIDMTTSSPKLAERIFEVGKGKGVSTLDAPVSGGDIGAKEARLSIMAGGGEESFETARPLLDLLGSNVVYQGKAGAGQHTKMCNQITIASNMMGVSEALLYAKKSGLNPDNVLKSITSGAAGSWSLSNLVPRMIDEDYAPGFYVKHFIKDLKIALESSREMEIKTPGLELALSLYEELAHNGEENSGTQALIKLLEN